MLRRYECGCLGFEPIPWRTEVEPKGTNKKWALIIQCCEDKGETFSAVMRCMEDKDFTPLSIEDTEKVILDLNKQLADGDIYNDLSHIVTAMVNRKE